MFDFGILGMNARNLLYIKKFNDKNSTLLADSKIKTKQHLSDRGIPFAATFAFIRTKKDLAKWSFQELTCENFVIKPNEGSKGNGILILKKLQEGFESSDRFYSEIELRSHMTDILDGAFSLGRGYDSIIIEECLVPDEEFVHFCQYGLADIRLIVFNLVPVAAEVRMPTLTSGGKANLAQGGIGLGIDVTTGEVNSFFHNKVLFQDSFPEKYRFLQGKFISYWSEILLYSSQIQIYVNLGYLALDWVITPDGPKLLEINARAGLEVQNVSAVPLRARLRKVENLKITDPLKGIEIAHSLFQENPVNHISAGKVLYAKQRGILVGGTRKFEKIDIGVNMNADYTVGNGDFLIDGERDISWLLTTSDGVKIPLIHIIPDTTLAKNTLILAGGDIEDYFVRPLPSPTYDRAPKMQESDWSSNIIALDEAIYQLNRKLNLSYFFKPTNYYQELDTFILLNGNYNPTFQYDFPNSEYFQIQESEIKRLQKICLDFTGAEISLISIFQEKIDEIETRILLLKSYENSNIPGIRSANKKLFGEENPELLQQSREKLIMLGKEQKDNKKLRGKLLGVDQITQQIHKYCRENQLGTIPVIIKNNNLSRISIAYGKKVRINISHRAIIYENELSGILAHELGVHLKRYISGKKTGLKIFQFGTSHYILDEEGLAVYESLKYLPKGYEKSAMYVKYYLSHIGHTMNFIELSRLLQTLYPEKSLGEIFADSLRVKRGIQHTKKTGIRGYMKDAVYLEGYNLIQKWISEGGDPYLLFQGKVKIADIPRMKLLFTF